MVDSTEDTGEELVGDLDQLDINKEIEEEEEKKENEEEKGEEYKITNIEHPFGKLRNHSTLNEFDDPIKVFLLDFEANVDLSILILTSLLHRSLYFMC